MESAKNTRFDIRIGGAVKRQPTELIIDLVQHGNTVLNDTGDYYFASIRGAIIAIGKGGLSNGYTEVIAWNSVGVPLDVVDHSAGSFDAYMSSINDVNEDIDVTGSFDTLIVTNRTQDMGQVIQDAWTFKQSYNYLVSGDEEGVLEITDLTGDSSAGENVVNFSALPPDSSASNGDVYEVILDESFDPAGFYLYWDGESTSDYEDGYFPRHDNWYRIPKSGQAEARYDPDIMPMRVILDEDNLQVILDICPWRQRVSGRAATIKKMPWALLGVTSTLNVNKFHIKSVEFFSGRLFLVSEKNVTSSRSDDYFNLWVDNVGAISNSDRISDDVTQNDVGVLLRAAACGQGLFLLCENGQLEYSSGEEKLTNINGKIRTITKYPSLDIAPGSGPGIVTIIDQFDDVHQYQWGGDRDPSILYTDMLSVHDPRRLENKTPVRILQVGTTVFIVLDDGTVEVHDTFIVQAQSVQSAWCTFTFKDPIVFFSLWNTRINVISHRTSGGDVGFSLLTYLHRIQPIVAPDLFVPRMDRMELIAPGDMTYDSVADQTTLTHTGRDGVLADSCVVIRSAVGSGGFRRPVSIVSGDPVFDGDLTDTSHWLGFTFQWEIELSNLYARISGMREVTMGMTVFYFDSNDFTVEWLQSPLATKTHTKSWQAHRVGVAVVGAASLETGSLQVPMATDPRVAIVKINSTSPGQVAIQALEYELQGQGRGKT